MISHYSKWYTLAFLVTLVCCIVTGEEKREEKLISTFQVVRFPNDICVGSNSRNGTCYTSQECTSKGGSSSGSCADGFGVCCTFIISTCGSSSSENLTAWKAPTTVSTGTCSLKVCPVSEDICSLRLDFTTFVITGPSTYSLVQLRRKLGQPIRNIPDVLNNAAALEGSTLTTNCLTDTFYQTSASPSTNPPSVCGTLTGEHMYVEADTDRCNMLMFNFGDATSATTQISNTRGVTATASRSWDITISHIECTSPVLPPAGCTKYWWGSGRATVKSYNYLTTAGSTHLAMQHDRNCIRRERGNCVGCFFAAAADVKISWNANFAFTVPSGCCGYQTIEAVNAPATAAEVLKSGQGDQANGQFGWECIIIPGAFLPVGSDVGAVIGAQTVAILQQSMSESPTTLVGPQPSGPQICGGGGGLSGGRAILDEMAIADGAGAGTIVATGLAVVQSICTRQVPFTLEFMSDDIEGMGGGPGDSEFSSATQAFNQGFKIDHTQIACG